MIIILGLVILVAAVIAGVAGVLTNGGASLSAKLTRLCRV
jgi:hypothetical protein